MGIELLTTASTLDDLATAGADNRAAFRRALRHSRHVRILRKVAPIAVALIVAGFGFAAWFDPLRIIAARLPVDNLGLVISGTRVTMASPKLSGYTRDARWYELSARGAVQDLTKPDVVELQELRAKLEMQDKSTMDLTAVDGMFDRKGGVLTLGRNVVLRSTSGFEVRLSEAVVDTATGNIASEKPVEVRMSQGTLNANKLAVTNSGEVVRFDGGVLMTLNPDAAGEAAKP